MGAAVLAAGACLRSGAGLLTCHIPQCGVEILQTAIPEAMADADSNQDLNSSIDLSTINFTSIGMGPGIGTAKETKNLISKLFDTYKKPMVLDADALNILSMDQELIKRIPAGSILTPHPKEFERLFGKSSNDFERIKVAREKAKELNATILLKGHHSLIASISKETGEVNCYFNSTGNAGMATGGSGDVLTGILTGLLAQGYSSLHAAILGVYLHGLAGDLAAAKLSKESMIAGDLTDHLGEAFLTLIAE
jgi:hydroxyethylthiazole kinase-like uncharacterized protein yjeF